MRCRIEISQIYLLFYYDLQIKIELIRMALAKEG